MSNDIEIKIDVYETHVRSNYLLFSEGCEANSLNNNMIKVNNKYTKVRYEISPSLTMKRASLP